MLVRSVKTRCFTVHRRGLSLPELLAAIVVGALVLMAVLGVYQRITSASYSVLRHLDIFNMPEEVVQLIAEDFDRIVATRDNIQVKLARKLDGPRWLTRLEIQPQPLQKIVWQTAVDFETDHLTLYRSRTSKICSTARVAQQDN